MMLVALILQACALWIQDFFSNNWLLHVAWLVAWYVP